MAAGVRQGEWCVSLPAILGHGAAMADRQDDRIPGAAPLPALNDAVAREIVEESIRIYFRKRRSRIPAFVDEVYSFTGALGLHRRALGHDLWRAPVNALMAGPQLGLTAAASLLERAGRTRDAQTLRSKELFFRTTVAQEIERRIIVDLLELPHGGPGAPSFRDALAVEILEHRRLAGALESLRGSWGEGERARIEALLHENLSVYLNARAAVGELTTGMLTIATGALTLQQWTPGFLTLGPAVAQSVAAKVSGVAGALAAGASVVALAAAASAYSGVLSDPLQRALGLHQRRLVNFLDALEAGFLGHDVRYAVGERYAARLIDVLDAMAAIWSHVKTTA